MSNKFETFERVTLAPNQLRPGDVIAVVMAVQEQPNGNVMATVALAEEEQMFGGCDNFMTLRGGIEMDAYRPVRGPMKDDKWRAAIERARDGHIRAAEVSTGTVNMMACAVAMALNVILREVEP
jgi:hypothetical protein